MINFQGGSRIFEKEKWGFVLHFTNGKENFFFNSLVLKNWFLTRVEFDLNQPLSKRFSKINFIKLSSSAYASKSYPICTHCEKSGHI